jgi:acetoin utilization deacetylase AcuC-like enzyme
MPGAPVFLSHPSSHEHDTGAHPEGVARMTAIERELESRGWLGYERIESPEVERAALDAIHAPGYIDAVETACTDGTRYLDLDTVISVGSCQAARRGSGGAARLVDLLLEGSAPTGFSAHRPPGHHAERARAGGFCLYNHVAVAAQHARDRHGLDRVMIFDWDVHHGNGTNDIFHSSAEVLYASIHQSPLYPGTGPASDAGSGAGAGFTVNLPVPPGADDFAFRSLVDHVVVPLARAFEPQLMLVSAGFDAHEDDPLANCLVTEEGFKAMAASVAGVGAELAVPVGAVLEGGYALGPLARSVSITMETLPNAGSPKVEPLAEVHPLARAARERLAEWWPELPLG